MQALRHGPPGSIARAAGARVVTAAAPGALCAGRPATGSGLASSSRLAVRTASAVLGHAERTYEPAGLPAEDSYPSDAFVSTPESTGARQTNGNDEYAKASIKVSTFCCGPKCCLHAIWARPNAKVVAHGQVIGVGGGGSNAVNRMLQSELQGVDLWIINTDSQVLGL